LASGAGPSYLSIAKRAEKRARKMAGAGKIPEKVGGATSTMQKQKILWPVLQVGDEIRLVEMPPEFLRSGHFVHPDTLRVYKKLIARRRPLRVYKIDAWGLPWVQCRFRRKDGRWEWHYLAVNHGGIVKVQRRKRTRRAAAS
jgi:hypothetical protein